MGRRGRLGTIIALCAALAVPTGATGAPGATGATGSTGPAASAPRRPSTGEVQRPLDPAGPGSARIGIGYQLYPRRDRSRPSLGTIVAVEGGPGYATTDSRAYFLDLFGPLLHRRQLLLVDNRAPAPPG